MKNRFQNISASRKKTECNYDYTYRFFWICCVFCWLYCVPNWRLCVFLFVNGDLCLLLSALCPKLTTRQLFVRQWWFLCLELVKENSMCVICVCNWSRRIPCVWFVSGTGQGEFHVCDLCLELVNENSMCVNCVWNWSTRIPCVWFVLCVVTMYDDGTLNPRTN